MQSQGFLMTSATENIHAYLERHQNKQMLRFLTCGSVDDGKSTLIGRLLHDTKGIYEDQLAAVQRDSVRHGTTGAGKVDLALLTDGLKAEREQGITIDVAYRYFSTDKRKFIIADTPGHEQYTRNMATGASTCDLAIILIDARHGVMVQTRRHSFIVSLLGIRHVVVAINKMDLAGYSQARFEEIRAEYAAFAAKLALSTPVYIPMSALEGDNVAQRSQAMSWYRGPSLLEHLETVPLKSHGAVGSAEAALRFPVQTVLRPDLDFRGFSGTIAAGTVRVGDAIVALPSGKRSRIQAIVTFDGKLETAAAGQAVTLVLADEIDISRGDTIVHAPTPTATADQVPHTGRAVEAMLVWMHEKPLVPGRGYLLKHTTRTTGAEVAEILHTVDVNTLETRPAERLALNEVGRVVLRTTQPLVFDAYADNHTTGALILIDRLTNNTVGAGMIVGSAAPLGDGADLGPVGREEKEKRLAQRGACLWVPRVEYAEAVERALFERGRIVVRLDLVADDLAAPQAAALGRILARQGILSVISGSVEGVSESPTSVEPLLVFPDQDPRQIIQDLALRGVLGGDEGFTADGI
jgi:bifunctional enzyme CysN/CysC